MPKGKSYEDREAWKNFHRKWTYSEIDYFTLINLMSGFPEFILKIYETKKSAIDHIYEFTQKIDEPVDISKPTYVSVGDWSLAQQLSSGIKGFSLEFAKICVEEYGLEDWDDCVKTLSEEGALEVTWQWMFEKNMSTSLAKQIRDRLKKPNIKDREIDYDFEMEK